MDKRIKNSMDKSKVALKLLIAEQEKARSITLKNLLNGEIEAYFALGESLKSCVNMLGSAQSVLHHDISDNRALAQYLTKRAEEIKATNAYDEAHQTRIDLKDLVKLLHQQNSVQTKCANISEACCELFANATERDPAKWTEIAGEIAVIWAGVAVGCVPYVSTVFDLGFGVKDTIQVIRKHTQEVPNYKNTDGELLLIEKHIEIMKTVTAFFNRITTEVSTFVNGANA